MATKLGGFFCTLSLRLLARPGGRAALTEDDALYLERQGCTAHAVWA